MTRSSRAKTLLSPAHQFFLCRLPRPPESLRQTLQKIGRDQRMLAYTFAHYVSGKTMKMHCGEHSYESVLRVLRDHSGNHAGQDVSRAAGCHSRIAGRIHPSLTVRLHHQRAMPFEHHDQFVFAQTSSPRLDDLSAPQECCIPPAAPFLRDVE